MSVLKRPKITEKSQALGSKGKYTFVVDINSNKLQIAQAVEKMYGVNVEKVNTITQIGKKKSRMTKTKLSSGKTNTFKKAIVTLKEGEMIDFYAEL
ncbi:MAG: 50S ribosomal protein L23 [Cytophagaceae bacterium]|nr:50S ribosomal protein L23 [Cytophagaceae bacterium]MBK9511390.1 50S ribosomal protein L23 [Cytophagaceae bacterium]MBK9932662.1 50S ribosomal protein L23 [Cytophagaceae bacterium]MBL0303646.1 50S ribosomal protein L23 [Cytophagaceae bacterium]MBL0326476.1 50S ribosomal protein L23 [Cytophagaceae bacterium]